jgi:hypothetical protein
MKICIKRVLSPKHRSSVEKLKICRICRKMPGLQENRRSEKMEDLNGDRRFVDKNVSP